MFLFKLGNNPTAKTIYKTLVTVKKQQQPHSSLPDLEDLNKYFASIGSILSSKLPKVTNTDTIQQVENTMVVYPTNTFEVTSIIEKMKNKKSCGEDGISNEILKCCSPIVDEYIAIAFNKCILEKTYPTCFKVAKVIPLHKKDDKSDPANYRPISLLSSLGKLFEKLLHKRMVKFCEKEKILTSTQYGFRSKRSCVDAISTVTEYIRTEIDRKSIGQICFIDLQKAFDTLDHNILLNKIEKYGFRGPIYHIVKSYLENRWQFVASDYAISSKRRIFTGVPQGSVLGPLLFLLYINDLHQVIKDSRIAMFADDTTVLNAGDKTSPLITQDLKNMTNWFVSNKLTVNVNKCEAICFGCGKPDKVTILSNELPYQKACKYLGLHLDGNLKFREHIDYVTKKLNKFCGLMYRVRHMYPRKCLLMFYNSFAKSVICYGLIVYGSAAKTNLKKIENAQRRILRAIFFKNKFDSLRDILLDNKIFTVYELYTLEIVKELFKQLRNESAVQYLEIPNVSDAIMTTRWRAKGLFSTTYSRTVTKRKSLENTLRKTYNWLKWMDLIPNDINKLSSPKMRAYITKLGYLYIIDNKELHSILF